ncbi:MAG: SDR family NAD(P)-dependent oxidoreductase [Acidobacteriota bacterium]
MSLRGRKAVITGASSGIGRAAAEALARAGVDVVLAARRQAELEEVADRCRKLGVKAEVIVTDVSDRDSCRALIAESSRRLGSIDILVNNAGFALYDPIESATIDDLQTMMNTNYFGAVHCTQAVLPQMIARGRGSIIFVSSITGIMGFSSMGGYSATKFALNGLAEALRDEVQEKGVQVSMICPGTTNTEFFVKAERDKQPAASRMILAMPPERVARAIVRAAETGSYRTILPVTALLFMRLKEVMPRTAHLLMRRVSAILGGKKH